MDVVNKIQNTPKDKNVFNVVSKDADIHSYRAHYASELYKQLENPERLDYHCRNDLKGVHYNKAAMLEVSRNLGHNRISVIASNYL